MEEKAAEERKRQLETGSAMTDMAGLNIVPSAPPSAPPRPPASKPSPEPEPEQEEEDENDPFGDSNAVDTPVFEKDEPKW